MKKYVRPSSLSGARLGLGERFGVRSAGQAASDYAEVMRNVRKGCFQTGVSSAGLLRPELSFPALLGLIPSDGVAPIYNFFDRTVAGLHYSYRTSRAGCRDYRGGTLSYDEHDGTDFVVPIGTPLAAAAPGTVVMIHDRWLRGGITVAIDHGHGLITQYTHCTRAARPLGDTIRRGETVAISGTTGFDMTHFFPWVLPHVHFMVWYNGRPVDPFLAVGETVRPGLWMGGNEPRVARPDPEEAIPAPGPVDERALEEAVAGCMDERIKRKLMDRSGFIPGLAAFVEDALHHDRWAWPQRYANFTVRPKPTAAAIKKALKMTITLPLPYQDYLGAAAADSRWSRPA
ncbi:MAG: M23 family metallopeptidase [Myxococcota bacterium]